MLLEVPHTTFVHTVGAMGLGADGMLYLGVGDGGDSSRAQDLSDLRGKVLRLDVAHPDALAPADNPFVGTPGARPGLVEAENFDNGGEGVAYHDVDAANQGGAHRTTGVDVGATGDAGSGFHVGYVQAGEWLEYAVNVATTGTYTIEVRVASDHSGGTFHVEFDGVDKTGPMRLPYTGGWDAWQTVSKTGVSLTAGNHVMRLAIDSSDIAGVDVGNINWVRVVAPMAVQPINWVERAAAPLARDEAQGAAAGGKAFVFGGFHTADFLASSRVDAYDVAANAWSARGPMPEAPTHSGVAADGATVWLVGGYVGSNPGPGTNHVRRCSAEASTFSAGATGRARVTAASTGR